MPASGQRWVRLPERLADQIIITDDNPRGEDGDVDRGADRRRAPSAGHAQRSSAIAPWRSIAPLPWPRAGDVVLIAGKGHETYQEGAAGKRPFDDLAVARQVLEARA